MDLTAIFTEVSGKWPLVAAAAPAIFGLGYVVRAMAKDEGKGQNGPQEPKPGVQ